MWARRLPSHSAWTDGIILDIFCFFLVLFFVVIVIYLFFWFLRFVCSVHCIR